MENIISDNINSEEMVRLKLTLLFFMEKMEIPLTQNSILNICSLENDWIPYLDCLSIIVELTESNFIYKTESNDNIELYSITYTGRNCLSRLYMRVSYERREKITEYVKQNKLTIKTSQEYTTDYVSNSDGSYTVTLRIYEPMITSPMFELKIKAPSRQSAIETEARWKKQAPSIFEFVYENLINTD
jgi:hypothetical protein